MSLDGRPMRYQEAVAAQGNNLRRSRPVVEAALAEVDLNPWRHRSLALAGMGASSHALSAAAADYLDGGWRVVAVDASDLATVAATGLCDAVVAVSQAGTSTETLAALATVATLPRLVVTNAVDSPVAGLADAVVPLGLLGDSAVYTLGYTATLQALGLLRAALEGVPMDDAWTQLPGLVEGLISDTMRPISALADVIGIPAGVDLVGAGTHVAAAQEGALILREASRIPTAAHSTRQYLHGPMESLGAGLLAVLVGDGREVELALDVARTGAEALLVTTADVGPRAGLTVLRLPPLLQLPLSVLEILPLQLLAGELAARQGLAIDGFRYEQLDTKSVAP